VKLSARNQLKGRVTKVDEGSVNGVVTVDVGGQSMEAVVTNEAIRELGLKADDQVMVIVKASHVILGKE